MWGHRVSRSGENGALAGGVSERSGEAAARERRWRVGLGAEAEASARALSGVELTRRARLSVEGRVRGRVGTRGVRALGYGSACRSREWGGWQVGRPGCGVRRLVPLRGGPGGENARPLRWVRLRKRLTAGPKEKEGACA